MVAYYKHHIPAWMDGTDELSDGAYRAYHVICQLIYLREGPITLNGRGIAGRCKQRVDRFQRHLDELIRAGKVKIIDGKIHNARAQLELDKIGPSIGNRYPQTPRGSRSTEGNPELNGSSPKLSRHSPKLSQDNSLKTLDGERCDASAASKTRQEEKSPPTPLVGKDDPIGWKWFQEKWKRSDAGPQAEEVFAALSEPDRLAAIDGIDGYVAEARLLDRQFVTAKKYLLQRRWEGVKTGPPGAAVPPAPTRVKVWKGTPEGEAWMAHYRSLGRNEAALLELNRLRTKWDFGEAYLAPSEWPPKVKEHC